MVPPPGALPTLPGAAPTLFFLPLLLRLPLWEEQLTGKPEWHFSGKSYVNLAPSFLVLLIGLPWRGLISQKRGEGGAGGAGGAGEHAELGLFWSWGGAPGKPGENGQNLVPGGASRLCHLQQGPPH